ncbi:MAG: hypothetical protein IKS48_11360 [Eubacterium sp.]|nr:hypothetical protein [Eubacterium sp.]
MERCDNNIKNVNVKSTIIWIIIHIVIGVFLFGLSCSCFYDAIKESWGFFVIEAIITLAIGLIPLVCGFKMLVTMMDSPKERSLDICFYNNIARCMEVLFFGSILFLFIVSNLS